MGWLTFIAKTLWPCAVVVLLLVFRKPVAALLHAVAGKIRGVRSLQYKNLALHFQATQVLREKQKLREIDENNFTWKNYVTMVEYWAGTSAELALACMAIPEYPEEGKKDIIEMFEYAYTLLEKYQGEEHIRESIRKARECLYEFQESSSRC